MSINEIVVIPPPETDESREKRLTETGARQAAAMAAYLEASPDRPTYLLHPRAHWANKAADIITRNAVNGDDVKAHPSELMHEAGLRPHVIDRLDVFAFEALWLATDEAVMPSFAQADF